MFTLLCLVSSINFHNNNKLIIIIIISTFFLSFFRSFLFCFVCFNNNNYKNIINNNQLYINCFDCSGIKAKSIGDHHLNIFESPCIHLTCIALHRSHIKTKKIIFSFTIYHLLVFFIFSFSLKKIIFNIYNLQIYRSYKFSLIFFCFVDHTSIHVFVTCAHNIEAYLTFFCCKFLLLVFVIHSSLVVVVSIICCPFCILQVASNPFFIDFIQLIFSTGFSFLRSYFHIVNFLCVVWLSFYTNLYIPYVCICSFACVLLLLSRFNILNSVFIPIFTFIEFRHRNALISNIIH